MIGRSFKMQSFIYHLIHHSTLELQCFKAKPRPKLDKTNKENKQTDFSFEMCI